jgi:hypothetical protein
VDCLPLVVLYDGARIDYNTLRPMQRLIDRDEDKSLLENVDPFLLRPPLHSAGFVLDKRGIEMRREKVDQRPIIMARYPGKKIEQG